MPKDPSTRDSQPAGPPQAKRAWGKPRITVAKARGAETGLNGGGTDYGSYS